MFQFSCRFTFLSTFRLSNWTPKNNANFDAISKRQHYEVNFLKHAPELIIFGTHNLQTFIHEKLINKLLLMQFYLINIRLKLHHQK